MRFVEKAKTNIVWIGIIVLVALFALYASPLSKGNVWVDTNAMLEVGRAWTHGYMPYRDVFEQHGPLMFFYFFVANVISEHGYIGLFVVEVLNLIGIWVVVTKLLNKVTNPILNKTLATFLVATFVLSHAFEYGGSPEEFATFWTLLGILMAYRFLDADRTAQIIRLGAGFGLAIVAVFLIKYTLLGALIGVTLVVGLVGIARRFKKLLIFGMTALGVFAVINGVVLTILHFLGDARAFINVYFITNMKAYSETVTFSQRLDYFKAAGSGLWEAYAVLLIIAVVAVLALIDRKKFDRLSTMTLVAGAVAFIITYGVGRFDDYSFLVILALLMLLVVQGAGLALAKRYVSIPAVALVTLSVAVVNPFVGKEPYIWTNQVNASKVMGDYISQQPGRKSLIYANFIDGGVERYANVDVAGKFKFFEQTNIPGNKFPDQANGLADAINNAKPDFIAYSLNWGGAKPADLSNRRDILSHISPQVLHNYRLVKVAASYAPTEQSGDHIQMALLERK